VWEIRNVRYWYFDASSNLFCIMTGIIYISPSKETLNCDQKFHGVLIRSNYLEVAEEHTFHNFEQGR
jgi:hypothetical protein